MFQNFLKIPLKILAASTALAGCCFCCRPTLPPADQPPPETIAFYTYQVVQEFPHDPEAFTQGLVVDAGFLYEGTGLRGESSIRKVSLETGEAVQIKKLPSSYFGEGIAVQGDQLIQLTWKSKVGFVYALDTFERIGDFSYLGEGWGLTHDGERFIMSDGTARLRFLDLDTFDTIGQVYVRYGDEPVVHLNELEYIDGYVYANVWQEDRIAIINPESGYVEGWVDMSGLLTAEEQRNTDVLNGIAYDKEAGRIFVTGKKWPKLFEITLIEARREAYPAVSSIQQ